jgi:hypothetical protein
MASLIETTSAKRVNYRSPLSGAFGEGDDPPPVSPVVIQIQLFQSCESAVHECFLFGLR